MKRSNCHSKLFKITDEWPAIVNRTTPRNSKKLTASPDYLPSNNTDGIYFYQFIIIREGK